MAEGVTVGAAAKIAAQLVEVSATTGQPLDQLIGLTISTTATIAEAMAAATSVATPAPPQPTFVPPAPQAPGPFDAAASIQNAFPGSTIVAPPGAPQPTNVVPFPQQPAGPAAIPGQQPQGKVDPQVEQVWQVFFSDIQNGTFAQNWHDNRATKTKPQAPDFKHKTWKVSPSDKFNASLWITSDKNPAWVPQQLRAFNIA